MKGENKMNMSTPTTAAQTALSVSTPVAQAVVVVAVATPAPASASASASLKNARELTILSNDANTPSTSQEELLRIIERLQTKTKFPKNNNDIRKLTFIIQSLIEHKNTPKTNETSKSIKTIIAQILTTTNPSKRVSEVDYLTQKLFPIEKSIFETNNTSRFENCDFSFLNQCL